MYVSTLGGKFRESIDLLKGAIFASGSSAIDEIGINPSAAYFVGGKCLAC